MGRVGNDSDCESNDLKKILVFSDMHSFWSSP